MAVASPASVNAPCTSVAGELCPGHTSPHIDNPPQRAHGRPPRSRVAVRGQYAPPSGGCRSARRRPDRPAAGRVPISAGTPAPTPQARLPGHHTQVVSRSAQSPWSRTASLPAAAQRLRSGVASFDRIVVIFNPQSTGEAPRLAEELRADLAGRLPSTAVSLSPTEHAGHPRDLGSRPPRTTVSPRSSRSRSSWTGNCSRWTPAPRCRSTSRPRRWRRSADPAVRSPPIPYASLRRLSVTFGGTAPGASRTGRRPQIRLRPP
jgi:hypothetical protein